MTEFVLGGFALGLLFGAVKVLLIGTVGFGIAWWRARRRFQQLEDECTRFSLTDERLDRLERRCDYVASQLDRLLTGQADLARDPAVPRLRIGDQPGGYDGFASPR